VIEILTVSQLTRHIKTLFDEDDVLQSVWIKGEISNYTMHASGHQYFTLKDEGASLRCVKFKFLGYAPQSGNFKTGDKVLVHGCIDLYAPQGSYQLRVTQIHRQGLGDLYQQFMVLKEKLAAEGLFDEANKKNIPGYPKVIGVVSSASGAVIQDILQTIERRFPAVTVRLAPAMMQGEAAAAKIIHALNTLDSHDDIDVIIIARGGGSMEDLWCFNDENLVRAIVATGKPVISAIGHETDFTLCDFAADLRAPTPTAAAELAVPDRAELQNRINYLKQNLQRQIEGRMAYYLEYLEDLRRKLDDAAQYAIQRKQHKLQLLSLRLDNSDPLLPFRKGFTLTLKDGVRVRSKAGLSKGDKIETQFSDGSVHSITS
jgi:exodeoxyribonuclease VII large subunit